MSKKKKSIYDSGTTKGSAPRTSDYKKYSDNWEKIFGKKKKNKPLNPNPYGDDDFATPTKVIDD
tara:strand:+ start:983 stop:1174 length:192 start_codon:yes stop_codon:yes gene_type:complete